MLSLPRFLSSINGGFGFGYDVLASFNTPSILDIEAYTQAKANASLNTKVNNSSITSNTINITSAKSGEDGGDITIIGGNLAGKQVNIVAKNNLEIKTQTEVHASINGNILAKAESIGSVILANPINVDGVVGVNVSTNSAKQSGIQSQNVQIKVNNQTKLAGAYISAEEKSTITTKSIKTNPLLHLGISTNQKIGIKGNANIIGGLVAGSFALIDLVFKTDLLKQAETIGNILFMEGTLNNGKWIDGETMITPKIHSSSVSKNITIKTNLIDGILAQRGEPDNEKSKTYSITNKEMFELLSNILTKGQK